MFVLILGVASPAPAVASPPAEDMVQSTRTFTEGEQLLASGEPQKAIAKFEAGLKDLPLEPGYAPTRARFLLLIVDAQEAAFATDRDLDRLYQARYLLDQYLGPLDLLDEQGRADAEERRVRLISSTVAVEKQIQVEKDARELADRRAFGEAKRRKGRALTISGAVLTSLGVAGLAVMGGGVGRGRATDDEIAALKDRKDWNDPCLTEYQACSDERRGKLDLLIARGNASNAMMIAGGVTGGVFLIAGVTLLVLGRKQKRDAEKLALLPIPSVTASSLGVLLHGRF